MKTPTTGDALLLLTGIMMLNLAHSARCSLPAITLLLAGCALTADRHAAHAPAAPAGSHAGSMDMQAMCAKHRQMMASAPAQHRAMMEERMQAMGMTADAMRAHMQEMTERCK